MEFDGIFSMEFHGVLGHGFPWNSMEFHGIRWDIFHGIPWSIRTWISMEFHGVFSRELAFHGFHGIPWKKEYQDEFH